MSELTVVVANRPPAGSEAARKVVPEISRLEFGLQSLTVSRECFQVYRL